MGFCWLICGTCWPIASRLLKYRDVDSANADAAGFVGIVFNPYRPSNGFMVGFKIDRGRNGLNRANGFGVVKGDIKLEDAILAKCADWANCASCSNDGCEVTGKLPIASVSVLFSLIRFCDFNDSGEESFGVNGKYGCWWIRCSRVSELFVIEPGGDVHSDRLSVSSFEGVCGFCEIEVSSSACFEISSSFETTSMSTSSSKTPSNPWK